MKIWTHVEMDALRQRYPVEATSVLAEEFEVTPRQVAMKAFALGVLKPFDPSKPRRGANTMAHSWTADEDAQIRRWWPEIVRRTGKNATWLATQLGVSRMQVRHRAMVLGLSQCRQKETRWSERELELLDRWLHLHPEAIAKRLQRLGFPRSAGAIAVQRLRRYGGLAMATGGYSANQLAALLGVTVTPVLGWIHKGWLKATPRGETRAANGGPGDRWTITPDDVRRFVINNASMIGPQPNLVWLIDLLTNAQATK